VVHGHPLASDIRSLQAETLGDPQICVAVLDGPVDLAHPCFRGANLRRLETLIQDPLGSGRLSAHGTHVTSVIFGQPNSPVLGIAPMCRGLIVPVFSDTPEGHLSQLDLARAIEQAVQEGAHIINVSGGERSPKGQADAVLVRALKLCEDNNVLVVAAAGNDGCECVHVPAALSSVVAVGALGADGEPLETSNWGEAYRSNGILASGQDIKGAIPGAGTASLTGSSFATPLVSGVAALLLSTQYHQGQVPDPRGIGQAILKTAVPCHARDSPECRRHLAGTLNSPGAYAYITKGGMNTVVNPDVAQLASQAAGAGVAPAEVGAAGPSGVNAAAETGTSAAASDVRPAAPDAATNTRESAAPSVERSPSVATPRATVTGVVPSSADCGCNGDKRSNVFAIGQIGTDFATEARRDSFRQLMPRPILPGSPPTSVPQNPYDFRQLAAYLNDNPWESTKLIWTLNLELTPIYALEAELAYADSVYEIFRDALESQTLPIDDPAYVSRLSVPGVLTNRTTRLFSGQTVPVVVVQRRGLYSWQETALVDSAIEAVQTRADSPLADAAADTDYVRKTLRIFLDKVYFQLRNLGQSPPDRAINFAATNAFLFTEGIANGLLSAQYMPTHAGQAARLYSLDNISVSKSSFCRMDSDCWDIEVRFFDPENDRRAKLVFQYTIDVYDTMPVSLAPTHQFLVAS